MDENRARALLEAERAEVLALLNDTEEAEEEGIEAEALGEPRDTADAALPLTQEYEDQSVEDSLRGRLAAIERALARLGNGTYGRSVVSGKPIPDERLEADPAAEVTVEEAKAGNRPR